MGRDGWDLLGLIGPRKAVRKKLENLLGQTTLSRAEIARLAMMSTARRYAAGETIIKVGVRGEIWGLVTKGQVAVFSSRAAQSAHGRLPQRQDLPLRRGSSFGESMLLEGRPSDQSLQALTKTEVYVLRREDLLALARQRRPALPAGRRTAPVWLAAALLALLLPLAAAGSYWGAQHLIHHHGVAAEPLAGEQTAVGSDAVRIISPASGDVLQRAASLTVRAVLGEPDLLRAELAVDGSDLHPQLRPQPDKAPWVAEWREDTLGDGVHQLVVRAEGASGLSLASAPVTVTIVPDGALYLSGNRNGNYVIGEIQTDGRGLRYWTAGPGETRQPAWRSDGALAFVAETAEGQAWIRWIAPGARQAVDLVAGRDPAWSPDGSQLAYAASAGSASQIFILSMIGGTSRQVTAEPVYAGQPSWSPAGDRLAYVAEGERDLDIWVLDPVEGKAHQLTSDPARDWAPAWSPDGGHLAFVSNRAGSHQIYVMNADGSGVRALTDFPQGVEAPAWAPDGSWLAFVAYAGDGVGVNAREIYLMRADGRDRLRLTHNAYDDSDPEWAQLQADD